MAEPLNIKPIPFTKEQTDSIAGTLAREGNPDAVFARTLTEEVGVDHPDLFTYEGLLKGTAPIFDQLPEFQNLPPEQRQLNNAQIISLFAVDEQGDPLQAGTFLEGVKREIAPSGFGLAGAYTGARIGYGLQQPIPPTSPYSVAAKFAIPVVTTTVGLLGGYSLGEGATDLILGPEKPITPGSRAAYEAGKTAANALGWIPMPYMVSKNVSFGAATYLDNLVKMNPAVTEFGLKGPLKVRLIAGTEKLLSGIGKTAKASPVATAITETAAGLGATGGAYTAETIAPGSGATRFAFEMGFGLTGGIIADRFSKIGNLKSVITKDVVGGLREGFGKKKRQNRAVAKIIEILESEGLETAERLGVEPGPQTDQFVKDHLDNIIAQLGSQEFADVLNEAGVPINLTAGMKADSPALAALESALSVTSPGLGKERAAKNVQANNALRNVIAALVSSGEPEALQLAAEMAEEAFSAGMTLRMQRASANVLDAFQQVKGVDPESNIELSNKLFEVVENQLSQARAVERNMWRDVEDFDIVSFVDANGNDLAQPNFITAWNSSLPATEEPASAIKSKLSTINKFVERKTAELAEGGSLSVTEVIEMRQEALSEARKLTASGDYNAARIASQFAEGLLDDLNSVPDGQSTAYDMARAYSRSLNDTFTRAFGGNVLEKTKKGSQRIAPELLAQRLQQGGSDPTYLRVQQINGIGQFAIDNGFEGAQDAAATIFGTQEMIIRNARAAAFNPETGQVNPEALRKWMNSNAELLDTFPALKADLERAETANIILGKRTQVNANKEKIINNQITFRNLLPSNVESPTFVVARALSNGNKMPIKSLNNLNDVVNNAPEELQDAARSGLRHSILEWAMTKGGGTSRSFSPRAMYDSLYSKIPNAQSDITVMDWMLSNNVISQAESNRMKKYLTEMVRLEVMDSQGTLGDIADSAGPMLDFYLRISGSALGTRAQALIPGQGTGSSLIAASAGSKLMRQVFDKVPESMKMDAMMQMMQDPELLAVMMSKRVSDDDKLRLAKRTGDILTKLGFIPESPGTPVARTVPLLTSDEDIKPMEEAEKPVVGPQSMALPPVPTQPAVPPTNALASVSPPPPPPAPASGTVDRARFAAMFPEDRALIEGIGGLMG